MIVLNPASAIQKHLRIHFFILRLDKTRGGSNQNAILFIRALRKIGHVVTVHTMFSGANNIAPDDIALTEEKSDEASFLTLQRACATAMARVETTADIFFVYGQALLWGAGMYRKGGHRPVTVYLDSHLGSMLESFNGQGSLHRLKHLLWEKAVGISIANKVDALLAVSPYLKERLVRAGFRSDLISVIPDAFEFHELPVSVHRQEGRIVSVGRLSYEKGIDVLIDACAMLPADLVWSLRLVGDGPERDTISQQIKHRELSHKIELVGWKSGDELAREYHAAEIFVLPSRVPEPFGRTVVEAMNADLPVIVPKLGGAAWVAGDAGATFHNGNPTSLAEVIARLVSDASLRRDMSKHAPRRAREFSSEKIGEALSLALQALIV